MSNLIYNLQDNLWSYICGDRGPITLTMEDAKLLHNLLTKETKFPWEKEIKNYKEASFWTKLKIHMYGTYYSDVHPSGVVGEMLRYKGKYYLINLKVW